MRKTGHLLSLITSKRAMAPTSRRNITSYPRPTSLQPRPSPICPNIPLTPSLPHPGSSPSLTSSSISTTRAPPLPSRPPTSPPPGWTTTSHALRAAYPRTFTESTGDLTRESEPFTNPPIPPDESKEARNARIERECLGAVEMRLAADDRAGSAAREDGGAQPGLWVAGERWVRDGSDGMGVGLVITHANGFTKESWHPTIRRLLSNPIITPARFGDPPLPSPPSTSSGDPLSRLQIDEVWFLDDIHHGASVDLNAGKLGAVHNWVDGGRDIIAVIEQTERRGSSSSKKRIVGLGHSFGANAMVQAAHARPDLFEAVLLVEPMCPPVKVTRQRINQDSRANLVFGALKRRPHWPDLESAAKVRSTPFFASWHPEVWDGWLSHGLVPGGDGGVQLATPKWGEAAVFAETDGLGLGWDKLAELPLAVGFVMAGNALATDGEETTREMVWRPGVCANERFMDAGHLIVQEKPDELADAIRRFLGNALISEVDDRPKAHL